VPAIWPFELPKTLYLAILKITSVNKILSLLGIGSPPFFIALTLDQASFKVSTYFQHTSVDLFHSLPPHFILAPHAFVFDLKMGLAIFALTMEQPVFEFSVVATAVLKSLHPLAIWKVTREIARKNATVSIVKCSLSLLNTITPLTSVHSSIRPPAGSKAAHFPL
jgi:hypothetical protein